MLEVETVAAPEIKPDFNEETYQERFRRGRLRANFSLAMAGAAAGISLQAIGQFELGKQAIKLDNFIKACDAMRLDVRWVLKGQGQMFGLYAPPLPKGGRRARMRKGGADPLASPASA